MDSTVCNASGPTPPLTVALVTETYPPEVNGVALTLARLVDGLRRRGHRVQLVRPRQSGTDIATTAAGFEEILVPGLPIPNYRGLHFGLPARNRLSRLWSQHRPSVVHVATEGPLGASAVAAASALNIPLSSSYHTNFDAYSRHYGLGWLRGAVTAHLRRLHNRTQLTLVPTQALAQSLLADGYENVRVMARGVDTKLFSPLRRCASLRASWGADRDTLVVAYVGRLAPEKNLHLVEEAYAIVSRCHPRTRLVFVGGGPSLKGMARRRPQHVFAGVRRGEDLAAHYASADLFLFPSLTETFGNVVPEALASGLAVVAFDCAAAADLIDNGINGRKVPAGDDEAFISAAAELATMPGQLAGTRIQAAASVAHLDWENIHDRFAAALAELVAAQRRKYRGEKHFVLLPD